MVTVNINGEKKEIEGGIIFASTLFELCTVGPKEKMFLDIQGEVDIQIDKKDYIFLLGEERFIIRKNTNLPDNPSLRKHLSVQINETPCTLSQAKVEHGDIAKHDRELPDCEVYVDLPNAPDFHLKKGCKLIVRNEVSFITIPKSNDDIIDIEECTKYKRIHPKLQKRYRIKIDGKKYVVNSSQLTGKKILVIAGLEWQRYDLQQKFSDGRRKPIEHDEKIDFTTPCVERFESIPREAQQGE